jgi:hypothetical protein
MLNWRDPLGRGHLPQALMARSRSKPATEAIWVLDAVDVLEKPQPRCLHDVCCVALRQLEVPRHRPDEPRVLANETIPRGAVARRGPTDELSCVGRGCACSADGLRTAAGEGRILNFCLCNRTVCNARRHVVPRFTTRSISCYAAMPIAS